MKPIRSLYAITSFNKFTSLGWRFWLWLLILGLLGGTFFHPSWTLPRSTYRYLFVFDITQSMNTRDYHVPALPSDRLGYAKTALEQALVTLPCGSEAGLAVFTHKNTHLILNPLEICQHGSAIRDALRAIDWRSAWAADSHIAYGLFDAIRTAKEVDAALVFLSDGEQFPATLREPEFRGKLRQVPGWILGVGGHSSTPIPKLDMEGHLNGYWKITDLPRQTLTSRYRTHSTPRRSGLLLSHLDETSLRRLAAKTGLDYRRLRTSDDLQRTLLQPRTSRVRPREVDLRAWLAGLALGFAVVVLI